MNVIRQMENKDVLALCAGALALLGALIASANIVVNVPTFFVSIFAIDILMMLVLTWVSTAMILYEPRSHNERTVAKATLAGSIIGFLSIMAFRPTVIIRLLVLPLSIGSSLVLSIIGLCQYLAVRDRFFPS